MRIPPASPLMARTGRNIDNIVALVLADERKAVPSALLATKAPLTYGPCRLQFSTSQDWPRNVPTWTGLSSGLASPCRRHIPRLVLFALDSATVMRKQQDTCGWVLCDSSRTRHNPPQVPTSLCTGERGDFVLESLLREPKRPCVGPVAFVSVAVGCCRWWWWFLDAHISGPSTSRSSSGGCTS